MCMYSRHFQHPVVDAAVMHHMVSPEYIKPQNCLLHRESPFTGPDIYPQDGQIYGCCLLKGHDHRRKNVRYSIPTTTSDTVVIIIIGMCVKVWDATGILSIWLFGWKLQQLSAIFCWSSLYPRSIAHTRPWRKYIHNPGPPPEWLPEFNFLLCNRRRDISLYVRRNFANRFKKA